MQKYNFSSIIHNLPVQPVYTQKTLLRHQNIKNSIVSQQMDIMTDNLSLYHLKHYFSNFFQIK